VEEISDVLPPAATQPARQPGADLLCPFQGAVDLRPAEGIYARLAVDPTGHILRETLSDHHHLTTRTFTYP
jgi:hypothetical protein